MLGLSLCASSVLSPFTSKGIKPFVWSAIFLFRTRSVNKILLPLTPVVLPCLFSFLFPSVLTSLGMILLFAHFLSAGIFFPLQLKMASIFFFTFIFFLLFLSLVGTLPSMLGEIYLVLLVLLILTWFSAFSLFKVVFFTALLFCETLDCPQLLLIRCQLI